MTRTREQSTRVRRATTTARSQHSTGGAKVPRTRIVVPRTRIVGPRTRIDLQDLKLQELNQKQQQQFIFNINWTNTTDLTVEKVFHVMYMVLGSADSYGIQLHDGSRSVSCNVTF